MLPIRTILYSTGYSKYSEYAFTDYSEHSEHAFHVACELARDYEARLIVLHVVDTIKSPRGRGDDRQVRSAWSGNDRDSLRKKLYRLKSADPAVRLEHQLREGSPVEEILRVTDDDRCDLIVMARAPADGAGSVADGQRGRGGAPARPLPGTCREEPPRSTAPGAGVGRVRVPAWRSDRSRAGTSRRRVR